MAVERPLDKSRVLLWQRSFQLITWLSDTNERRARTHLYCRRCGTTTH